MTERVYGIKTPVRLDYTFAAGQATTRFLHNIARKRIVGQRCPSCTKVYVPPRGACPTCGVATAEEVTVPDTGIVTTFCIVNIPFAGQSVKVPYVSASILLDGSDIPLFHLVQEVDAHDVRMGMRVQAVWVPDEELSASMESIRHFRPTGEPDAAFETFREHL